MSYREQGENVVLTISKNQYLMLMMALGIAAGTVCKQDERDLFRTLVKLTNSLNIGNPNYKPYEESE